MYTFALHVSFLLGFRAHKSQTPLQNIPLGSVTFTKDSPLLNRWFSSAINVDLCCDNVWIVFLTKIRINAPESQSILPVPFH